MIRRMLAMATLALLAACGDQIVEPDGAVEVIAPPRAPMATAAIIPGAGPDDDGVPNATFPVDNCPTTYNPDQADSNGISDGDGIGDACEMVTHGFLDIRTQAELDAIAGVTQNTNVIQVYGSDITDLSPLASLVDARSLVIGGTELDLSPLSGLRRVESLRLLSGGVTDFDALAGIEVSDRMGFSGVTGLTDLGPIGAVQGLTSLQLFDNPDLQSLAGLEALQLVSLRITRNLPGGISDLSPLDATRLELVEIFGLDDLETVDPVLTGSLRRLDLSQLPRVTLPSLAGRSFTSLGLSGLDLVQDLSILSGTTVGFLRVGLPDVPLSGLEGVSGLEQLWITARTGDGDLSPIPTSDLKLINLVGVLRLEDLGTLGPLPVLENLRIVASNLENLSGLPSLPSLRVMELSNNRALTSLQGLNGVDAPDEFAVVFGNPILEDCLALLDAYQAGATVFLEDNGPGCLDVLDSFGAPAPTGTNVPVTPNDQTGAPGPITLTFDEVTTAGQAVVTQGEMTDAGAPPFFEADFSLGEPPTYYDITTSAVFEGLIRVCVDYSSVSYSTEAELVLLHYVDDEWEDITDDPTPTRPNPDPATQTVCGTTTSLSPFVVAESNVAPMVTKVAVPPEPILVGSEFSIAADFTDGNPDDAHTASIDWGDGTVSPGVVTEAGGVGTVAGLHAYAGPGVYPVTVTVDDGGLTGSRSSVLDDPAYVVVYDPSGGFVTGGGWIDSPVGACTHGGCASDGSTTGKASFGFVAKFRKGTDVPEGSTQFKVGDLDFQGTAYDWLVVAGAHARFSGVGTINGEGEYGFMLTAIDGGSGNDSTDAFRIKIIDRSTDVVVYDNEWGEDDAGGAATEIGGGSIIVHNR